MQTDDISRIKAAVSLAERLLPLDKIASGPALEMGAGLEFKHHSALDFVVHDLNKHIGVGWRLIRAALQSPVIRNRNLAVCALGAWGRANWPSDAEAVLRASRDAEPDPALKQRLERVLAGKPLE